MQLPITVTNPLSAPLAQATGRGLPWRAGAVLQAVVLEVAAPGRVELQIGNQTISARTLFPLAEGQVLSLRVAHTGELVVLQQEPSRSGAPLPRADAAVAQQALRQALPRQGALPPLLANLTLLTRTPQAFPPALVEAAREVLKVVPDAGSLAEPDVLAARVERSGLWLESTLASHDPAEPPPATPLSQDWKGALLRLAASLSALLPPAGAGGDTPSASTPGAPAPGATPQSASAAPAPPPATAADASAGAAEGAAQPGVTTDVNAVPTAHTAPATSEPEPLLRAGTPLPQARAEASLAQTHYRVDDIAAPASHLLKQVEGALARVELGQLASLRSDDTQPQAWWLELPVRAADGETDVLQLRIEHEGGGSGDGDGETSLWAVSLAFDLGELGPVRARVAVRGDSVSTLFFAELAPTVERLRAELAGLESALAQRGLKVGSMGCRAGRPGAGVAAATRPPDAPLLEVEA